MIGVYILLIINLIGMGLILSGFWDMYKRVREIEHHIIQKKDEQVSQHLQKVGSKGLSTGTGRVQPKSFQDLHKGK